MRDDRRAFAWFVVAAILGAIACYDTAPPRRTPPRPAAKRSAAQITLDEGDGYAWIRLSESDKQAFCRRCNERIPQHSAADFRKYLDTYYGKAQQGNELGMQMKLSEVIAVGAALMDKAEKPEVQ